MRASKLFKPLWKPLITTIRHYAYPQEFTYFLKNQGEHLVTTMDNGLIVATDERPTPNACVGLYFDAGSRYESFFEKGIAHFFEHIAFKSTRMRNKAMLQEQMMCSGARFSCYTNREMAAYYVECLCPTVPLCLDILSDCVFNNGFSQEDLDTQAEMIAKELEFQDTNTTDVLFNYLHTTAFQKTSLADPVVGPLATMCGFSPKIIGQYIRKWLIPSRAVLVVVGGISHAHVVHLANTYICMPSVPRCTDYLPYRYTGSEVLYRDDSKHVADVIIAVEAPSYCDDDKLIMDAAATIIGGWDRSQLGGRDHPMNIAQAGSSEHCLDAYKSFYITYKDCGLWGVRFLAPGLYLDDVVYFIQSEWMRLCQMITEGEVNKAKHEMKTQLMYKTENSTRKAHMIGRSLLYKGDWEPLYSQLMTIDKINVDKVKAACTKYIYNKCPVVVGIGPTEALPEYNRIRAGMYWLRV